MSKETECQAFPRQQWEYDGQNNVLQYQEEGMTLRDYFAAKAMQSLYCRAGGSPAIEPDSCDYFAHHAYQMADAMLKARNK